MSGEVVVVGAGMVTAVGLSAAETAASVRAATARFGETSILDHRFAPVVLAEVPDDGVPSLADELTNEGLTAREARMIRLAGAALLECLKALPPGEEPPAVNIALPETETTRPLDHALFLQGLGRQTGGRFDVQGSDPSHRGRAGGLVAIGQAAERIRAARARFALAGGVDTYRDLYLLAKLDVAKRVKSAAHLDGFIPGEAAGFLLLADGGAASGAGLTPWASLSLVASAAEPGHLASEVPYRGEGLALAVQQLLASGALRGPILEVYSSMNGESHWAKEWGVTFIRNSGAFGPEYGMHHPADSYGDPGAAAGALLVGLAAMGIRQGQRRSPALVYASSDTALRAALLVTAA